MEVRMLTGFRDFDDTLRTFDALQRRLDSAFGVWSEAPWRQSVARDRARRPARAAWPATNAFETKDTFVVKAEVPGLAEGDVSVSIEDDALVLRGERKATVPEGYRVHLRERASVAFARRIPLPTRVDADAVTATLHDGVLTVTLPKAREALPRQIAVKAG
jgi:HSP20 family protein